MASRWTATRMSLRVLLVVALFHTVVSADQAINADQESNVDEDPRRYLTKRSVRVCGVKLVDMMKKVCNHCYKTRKHEQQRPRELAKRSAARGGLRTAAALFDDEDASDANISDHNSDDDQRLLAVRRGLDALDVFIDKRWGGDTRRPRQPGGVGIANKCCLNQCSYGDLVSYCCATPSP